MSAQQKIQEHPVFKQAQSSASYYVAQLDKEVRCLQLVFGPLRLSLT